MSAVIIGARTVTPSNIEPGDVISDIDGNQAIMVDVVKSIKIRYGRRMLPVWWIKGVNMGFGESWNTPGQHKVQTVCLPGQQWYLLHRKSS